MTAVATGQPVRTRMVVGNTISTFVSPGAVYDGDFRLYDRAARHHLYLICSHPRLRFAQRRLHFTRNGDLKARVAVASRTGRREVRRSIVVPRDQLPFAPADRPRLIGNGLSVLWSQGEADAVQSVSDLVKAHLGHRELNPDLPGRPFRPWRRRRSLLDDVTTFFTLRVDYVGRSYGTAGSRTTTDRLGAGHARLGQLLADVNAAPDREVQVVLLDCIVRGSSLNVNLMDGPVEGVAPRARGMLRAAANKVGDGADIVTLMEAALIGYFQPDGNFQHKSFPKLTRKSYARFLRENQIDGVEVVLDVSHSLAVLRLPGGGTRSWVRVNWDMASGQRIPPAPIFGIRYDQVPAVLAQFERASTTAPKQRQRRRRSSPPSEADENRPS